ncbi:cytochrome P450 [Streptomyces mashuensis]|uniref:Cytochrome P450 n=1 Tax=Streptomyces mashuensis TaxID=33904 RepID=A0A919B7D5_9ACTN|nr:cytochrome P450 [Streptomyces mashuensis]GHF65229.1 cytochrome P450 [Streptomyces mashuensis]
MTPSAAPGAWPLVGHAPALLRDPLGFLASLPAHGDLVAVRIGPFRAVVVCDPALTRQVLADDRTYDKGGPIVDRAAEAIGRGLGTCPHSEHRRQRRLTQPAFHPSRMAGYARVMAAGTAAVTAAWRHGEVLDVLAQTHRIAHDVVVEALFTGALPPEDRGRVVEDVTTVLTHAYRRAVLPPLAALPTPANRRYHRARARLRRTLHAVVTERRAHGTDHGDLLSALDTTRSGLTVEETVDQAVAIIAAGTDTTAVALAWALHLLARRPAVQHRVAAEATTVLGGATPDLGHVPGLALTGRVLDEALRLYPPGWLFTRTVTTPTALGGCPLPAGTTVVYSPYVLHHRPDLHPQPGTFDPDRTLRKDAFLPFATGPRTCIGARFATVTATLALAHITRSWHLEPVPGTHVRPATGLVLRPSGLRLRVLARGTGGT